MGPKSLEQLQRWLLDEVTRPAGLMRDELEKVILPSERQSAADRLEVYRSAYFARLLEVLREQFPCTRFAVGDELFDEFAVGYLEQYPPASYTLARLADQWVDYLDKTRPPDWGRFVVELARLEQAIDRVFDGPGAEGMLPFQLPTDAAGDWRLSLVPGLELLALHYPVSRYYTEWKAGREPAWPEKEPQFVALLRRDYIVRRFELSEVQFKLLAALAHRQSIGEALADAAVSATAESLDELVVSVRAWFAQWASQGFFAGTENAAARLPGD